MAIKRPAFTLLELILALALSVVVMIAISTAIYLHLRLLDTRRAMVEKAQVARVILNMMAEDIRSAVQQKPVDVSMLEGMISVDLLTGELFAEAGADPDMLNDLLGGGGISSGLDLGGGGEEGSGGSTGGEEEPPVSSTIATSVEPPPIPGLYGDATSLQVDVSKLPRFDQWNPTTFGDDLASQNVPVDIKTIAYFLGSGDFEDDLTTVNASALADQNAMGLYRREMPRAVTAYAIENGAIFEDETLGELIAPEVASLSFRYHDGTDWVESWDSDEMGSLPQAVEIIVLIASSEEVDELQQANSGSDSSLFSDGEFRLVVHLPMAELANEESEDEMSDEGADGEMDGGGSSGGAGSDSGGAR